MGWLKDGWGQTTTRVAKGRFGGQETMVWSIKDGPGKLTCDFGKRGWVGVLYDANGKENIWVRKPLCVHKKC